MQTSGLPFLTGRRKKEQDVGEIYCDNSRSLGFKRSPLLQPQWEHHLPSKHATFSRQKAVAESFQASNQTGTRAGAAVAKALHQCYGHSFPTSWHFDRHTCWTWYCLDRFRMERWEGGGAVTRYDNHSLRSLWRGPAPGEKKGGKKKKA